MLTEHLHKPGEFDPGHCRDCARETDLLDHYHHVQRQEQTVREAHRWACQARRHAYADLVEISSSAATCGERSATRSKPDCATQRVRGRGAATAT